MARGYALFGKCFRRVAPCSGVGLYNIVRCSMSTRLQQALHEEIFRAIFARRALPPRQARAKSGSLSVPPKFMSGMARRAPPRGISANFDYFARDVLVTEVSEMPYDRVRVTRECASRIRPELSG